MANCSTSSEALVGTVTFTIVTPRSGGAWSVLMRRSKGRVTAPGGRMRESGKEGACSQGWEEKAV